MATDHSAFLEDFEELLNLLMQATLAAEEEGVSKEHIDEIFRCLHNIKGAGKMFGFKRLADFTHQVEDLYDDIRAGEHPMGNVEIQFTLDAIDVYKDLKQDLYVEDPAHQNALEDLESQLEAIKSGQVKSEVEEGTSAASRKPSLAHCIRMTFAESIGNLDGHPAYLLLDDILDNYEKAKRHSPKGQSHSVDLFFLEGVNPEELEGLFIFYDEDVELQVLPFDTGLFEPSAFKTIEAFYENGHLPSSSALSPSPKEKKKSKKQDSNTIRVPASELDGLMNWFSELVTIHAGYQLIAKGSSNNQLITNTEQMGRVLHGMREIVFGISLVPLTKLTNQLRKLVRDLSKELEKPVSFLVEGADTQLNKDIIEPLHDPLVHIVRNALDHGLETAEERQKAGKATKATLHFLAERNGNHVHISIKDDGKGIDLEKVYAKAMERGLLNPDLDYTDEEIMNCIFEPGFSTAKQVTGLSGRGVGMDTVKKSLKALGGSVVAFSERGKGTEIKLQIPLTTSIVDGLLFRLGDEAFVLPLTQVERIHEIDLADLCHGEDTLGSLYIDDTQLNILRMDDIYGLALQSQKSVHVIECRSGSNAWGLVVDKVLGQQQVVIKTSKGVKMKDNSLNGTSILGDGSLAQVIDVENLIENHLNGAYQQKQPEA